MRTLKSINKLINNVMKSVTYTHHLPTDRQRLGDLPGRPSTSFAIASLAVDSKSQQETCWSNHDCLWAVYTIIDL